MDPQDAFANDDARASARLSDNLNVKYGTTASALGSNMLAAFRTLAEAGTIGEKPTAAQLAALKTASNQIDAALTGIRTINAENGRIQAQVDALVTRAQDRTNTLKSAISTNEDADLSEVATNLSQQKTMLQASYSVFGQLSTLNLTNYLK